MRVHTGCGGLGDAPPPGTERAVKVPTTCPNTHVLLYQVRSCVVPSGAAGTDARPCEVSATRLVPALRGSAIAGTCQRPQGCLGCIFPRSVPVCHCPRGGVPFPASEERDSVLQNRARPWGCSATLRPSSSAGALPPPPKPTDPLEGEVTRGCHCGPFLTGMSVHSLL